MATFDFNINVSALFATSDFPSEIIVLKLRHLPYMQRWQTLN